MTGNPVNAAPISATKSLAFEDGWPLSHSGSDRFNEVLCGHGFTKPLILAVEGLCHRFDQRLVKDALREPDRMAGASGRDEPQGHLPGVRNQIVVGQNLVHEPQLEELLSG